MAQAEPKMVDGIIFSDSVIREEGTGKLSIIGSFQHFNVPKVPFLAPPFFVTAIFTNLRPPLEKLHLTVRMEEAKTGHVVGSTGVEIGFTREPEMLEVFEIPLQIPPTQLVAAVYKVVVLADNEVIGTRNLPVRSVTGTTKPT